MEIENQKSKIKNYPPLRGVILDMDGVIVDSEPIIKDAAVRMFAEKGYAVHAHDFDPFMGTGEVHLLGSVAEKYGIPFDADKDKARTYAIYLELVPGRLRALPGVFTFIEECRRRQLKLGLASSADAVKVKGNLAAIGLPARTFDMLVNGSEVARKKPFPDIFLTAAEGLQLACSACLVVEDAVAGVQAAKSAGARCLALTTSFPAEKLVDADWIAPDLSQVPAAIFDGAPS
jgi:HAD superfamily hydrolase (TIGR01509 family)